MLRDNLGSARRGRNDEFYTLYEDIKLELDHYLDELRDKVIYCPCDTSDSQFVKYFSELKDKGLIKDIIHTSIQEGISFDSPTAMNNYSLCDVIVTNPPFSLFRQFVELVDRTNKKFIIWGNNNALTYWIIAKLFKQNRISLGYSCNKTCKYEVPKDYSERPGSKAVSENGKYYCVVPSCSIFTNYNVPHQALELSCKYSENEYKKYDNYDAININKVKDIPYDYDGPMGVPITYLSRHDPSKFKVLGLFNNTGSPDPSQGKLTGSLVNLDHAPWRTYGPCVDGNALYARIIIQKV